MTSNQLPTRFDFSLEKEDDGTYLASGELGCGKDVEARSAIAIAIMASMIEYMKEIRINGEIYSLEDILDGFTFNPEPKGTQVNLLENLTSLDALTYQQANRFVFSNEMRNLRLVDGMWYADDQPYLIDRHTYLAAEREGDLK